MKIHTLFLFTTTTALAAFPGVGPDYQRPSTVAPAAYRDLPADLGTWKTAVPADDLARGEWWKLYADPVLDDLEKRALAANQQLRAAVARLDEARAAAGLARSGYFPSVIVDPSVVRER